MERKSFSSYKIYLRFFIAWLIEWIWGNEEIIPDKNDASDFGIIQSHNNEESDFQMPSTFKYSRKQEEETTSKLTTPGSNDQVTSPVSKPLYQNDF